MAAAISLATQSSLAGEGQKTFRTYGEAKEYLSHHTNLLELTNEVGARVAICPAWQGRVMTSTCSGSEGPSFGFIHKDYIDAGKEDLHFNNYGGEDRLWMSPEGGPFSLWFAPGAPQTLEYWFTPQAFNTETYDVLPTSNASTCRMVQRMKFKNTAATDFDLAVTREIRLLDDADLARLLGPEVANILKENGVKSVAFETVNTVTNQGAPMEKPKGLVSMWILSMLNAGAENVIVVPYRSGAEQELGPVVRSDYFGQVPADRLKVTPEAILLSADAGCRSKIGVSPKRAKNILAAVDFGANVMTLGRFSLPEEPTKAEYLNNLWGADQPNPYLGDAVNAYNDGPSAPGKKGLGPFCEIESLSPAAELKTGQSITHRHCTIHIQADPAALARIAKLALGVDLKKVQQEMLPKK
jgi:hypothetical protein